MDDLSFNDWMELFVFFLVNRLAQSGVTSNINVTMISLYFLDWNTSMISVLFSSEFVFVNSEFDDFSHVQ